MMERWREVGLTEAVLINPSTREAQGGRPRRRIMLEHLEGWRKRVCGHVPGEAIPGGARFRNGDVLLARISPSLENGKTALVDLLEPDEVAAGSTELLVLRARPEILEPAFLYYLAISPHFRGLLLTALAGTTGRLRVPSRLLPRIRFCLPPLAAQQQLAARLKQLDDRVELNHGIMGTLTAWQRAVSLPFFQRCLPAGAGGPSHNGSGGVALAALLHPRRSCCPPAETLEFSVSGGGVQPRRDKAGLSAGDSSRTCKVAHRHDLVFGLSRDALNWGMMGAEMGGVSKAYQVYKVDRGKINPLFLAGFIGVCGDYFGDILKPATREGQSIDSIRLMGKIFYPPDRETQERYAGIIGAIAEKRAACCRENAILRTVRDDLLRRHFSVPAGFRVQESCLPA